MSLTEKDIRKIAKLARIGIKDEDIAIYKNELSNILGFMAELETLNTDNIDPLYSVINQKPYLRKDIEIVDNKVEEILSNTEYKEFNCFKVPKVIE